MASTIAARRLARELAAINRDPVPHITTRPRDDDILEWHYVIEGTSDTPYAGGHYHGTLKFPADYPLRPPSVIMLTPSGRFKTGRRLCLSMSDFHPESWNPMWSVATILTGLYSFMLEDTPTLGSVDATPAQRKLLAKRSLAANCQNETFRALFPELVELHDERRAAAREAGEPEEPVSEPAPATAPLADGDGGCSWVVVGVGVVAVLVGAALLSD